MSLACECGEKINDTPEHLVHKAHVLPAQEWDTFWKAVDDELDKPHATPKDREAARLRLREQMHTWQAYQCGKCGRLYLQDTDGSYRGFLGLSPRVSKTLLKKRT